MKRRRRAANEATSVANLETQQHSKPSFFKLMLSPTSQSYKLRIPEKFVSEYHEELGTSSTVTLMVPTGETWKLMLTKEDNKLWFHEGWQDFVKSYSIDYGYFMLFIYEGNMRFNVHVFDLTTCEISYHREDDPCHDCLGEKQVAPYKGEIKDSDYDDEVEEEEDEDDDEDENEDDDNSDDSDFECLGSHLSSPNDYSDSQVRKSDGEDDDDDDDDDDHRSSETRVGKRGTSRKSNFCVRSNRKALMKAVIAAGIRKPKTSFFVAEIKAYSLFTSLYLNIPTPFARALLRSKHDDSKDIELEAIDGRRWTVKCIIHGSKSMLSKGWTPFVREIGLEVGDICVFEVITSKSDVLKVQVAKKSQIGLAGLNI